jgi:hypothetical protein
MIWLQTFMVSVLDGSEWWDSRSGRFTQRDTRYPLGRRLCGENWRREEISSYTGYRTPVIRGKQNLYADLRAINTLCHMQMVCYVCLLLLCLGPRCRVQLVEGNGCKTEETRWTLTESVLKHFRCEQHWTVSVQQNPSREADSVSHCHEIP